MGMDRSAADLAGLLALLGDGRVARLGASHLDADLLALEGLGQLELRAVSALDPLAVGRPVVGELGATGPRPGLGSEGLADLRLAGDLRLRGRELARRGRCRRRAG